MLSLSSSSTFLVWEASGNLSPASISLISESSCLARKVTPEGHNDRQPLPQTQLQTGPRFVDAVLSLSHVLKSSFSGCWIAGFISTSSKPPQSYQGETKVVTSELKASFTIYDPRTWLYVGRGQGKWSGRNQEGTKPHIKLHSGFKEGTLMSVLYFMSVHSNMILERGNLWWLSFTEGC